MKKLLKLFIMALLIIPCMFGFVACGDAEGDGTNNQNGGGGNGGQGGTTVSSVFDGLILPTNVKVAWLTNSTNTLTFVKVGDNAYVDLAVGATVSVKYYYKKVGTSYECYTALGAASFSSASTKTAAQAKTDFETACPYIMNIAPGGEFRGTENAAFGSATITYKNYDYTSAGQTVRYKYHNNYSIVMNVNMAGATTNAITYNESITSFDDADVTLPGGGAGGGSDPQPLATWPTSSQFLAIGLTNALAQPAGTTIAGCETTTIANIKTMAIELGSCTKTIFDNLAQSLFTTYGFNKNASNVAYSSWNDSSDFTGNYHTETANEMSFSGYLFGTNLTAEITRYKTSVTLLYNNTAEPSTSAYGDGYLNANSLFIILTFQDTSPRTTWFTAGELSDMDLTGLTSPGGQIDVFADYSYAGSHRYLLELSGVTYANALSFAQTAFNVGAKFDSSNNQCSAYDDAGIFYTDVASLQDESGAAPNCFSFDGTIYHVTDDLDCYCGIEILFTGSNCTYNGKDYQVGFMRIDIYVDTTHLA